ncbi:glucan biosynthesis protein [Pseudodesulfovibrio sediminis]|uniref:Glucans biosynthesis protein G n=1 Tax=Pseudodesulfovibrio sediminis TaxID=2810563 RepID=A0ABM7P5I3_9BACT|nr:glucan biosynthesis protein [Pseudodesulfovibrio sediminis]BCS88059.1 glucans biosynthesis protein G [Pseudodesulfovibrio sediminis]
MYSKNISSKHISLHARYVLSLAAVLSLLTILGPLSMTASAQDEPQSQQQPPQQTEETETPFNREILVAKALELSLSPFEIPQGQVPQPLLDLSYDAWREIQYRPERALWKKERLPFEIQLFHPGMIYDHLVDINIVKDGHSHRVAFDSTMFDYGSNHAVPEQIPDHFGFAGFRIHGPINTPKYFDEIAAFLGASYLRAVAKGGVYGLSARGLAVDTAQPDGEEFPYFREYWIEKPTRHSTNLTVHALLDSRSMTGAYTFVITGGKTTTMDVTATLFLRKSVSKIGIAPLTSMFLFGENTDTRKVRDFRPEVHDSDGLLIKFESQEWFWHPLNNPETLQIDAFKADNVQGFGLIQRDHDFEHYQDFEANYERRPSLWVEPRGNWGRGHVELISIPTNQDIHDNIVAFWTPDEPLPEGVPQTYEYQLRWYSGRFTHPPLGYVESTWVGDSEDGGKQFAIDFNSKALGMLKESSPVLGIVTCGKGAVITDQNAQKNMHTGGWRLTFVIHPDEKPSALDKVLLNRKPPVDIRAFLKLNETTLTETWNYAYQP